MTRLVKRILYMQYTNPAAYPPLLHSSRILADQGWKVRFLGTGADGANDLEVPVHENITTLKIPFAPPGWRQKLHFAFYHLWVVFVALLWRPNWIYAADFLSCPSALFLKLLGFHVAYHEHDSPTQVSDSAFQGVLLAGRRVLSRKADFCVVPNEARGELLKTATATSRPICIVRNCALRSEVQSRNRGPDDTEVLKLFYHGSIVPARIPIAIIEAMASLPNKVVLTIAGYPTVGHPNYRNALKREAAERGIEDDVHFLGPVPDRAVLLRHCREATVGLALMPMDARDANEQTMLGASNKPFDYMACGLALLVSRLPDWEAQYVSRGFGRSCDPSSPESVAEALRWFIKHPEETNKAREYAREQIKRCWNYETEFTPVLDRLSADR
ncbi:MAG: glycosyltransferase [Chthoniobacterales bacterium]|nr:MAG: glycosyltransferase [Chthoniobacterales bacterium]